MRCRSSVLSRCDRWLKDTRRRGIRKRDAPSKGTSLFGLAEQPLGSIHNQTNWATRNPPVTTEEFPAKFSPPRFTVTAPRGDMSMTRGYCTGTRNRGRLSRRPRKALTCNRGCTRSASRYEKEREGWQRSELRQLAELYAEVPHLSSHLPARPHRRTAAHFGSPTGSDRMIATPKRLRGTQSPPAPE